MGKLRASIGKQITNWIKAKEVVIVKYFGLELGKNQWKEQKTKTDNKMEKRKSNVIRKENHFNRSKVITDRILDIYLE